MSRRQKCLEVRNKFYILTNGKETEKNYFDLIKSKKSIYDVKIEYHNEDPYKLVEYGTSLKSANQVWCVFDIDNTVKEGSLIRAIELANNNDVQIAFSNIAFEVWLLSHYSKVERCMNNKELIKEMNKLLKCKLNFSMEYDKSDKELLKKHFIPNYKMAIENSKIIHQKYIVKHEKDNPNNKNYKIWEWNSCTNVYKLIEAFQLEK